MIDAPTLKLDLDTLQHSAELFVTMKPGARRRIDGAVWATHALELIAEVRRLQGQNQTLEAACSRKDAIIRKVFNWIVSDRDRFGPQNTSDLLDEVGKR